MRRRASTGFAVARCAWALAVLALLLSACSSNDGGSKSPSSTVQQLQRGGTLRVGVVGSPGFDPATVTPTVAGQMIAADLLYDGLTAYDPETGDVVPGLASWTASDDLTTWTFTIPDEAQFSDGSAVTADDVVASLSRVAARGDQSIAGVRLEVIDGYAAVSGGEAETLSGVKAVDDHTVEITTTESNAELPALLAAPSMGIVPAEEATADEFPDEPVGSGPFAVAAVDDESAVLDSVSDQRTNVDGVELVFFDTLDESYQAFVDGDLDWSWVPADQLADAEAEYGDGQFFDYFVEFWLGMNLTDGAFTDPRVREAIVRGVDRTALVEKYYPGATLMQSIVPAGVPGAQPDACGDLCQPDTARAQQLIGEVQAEGELPTINFDYDEEDFDPAAAEAVKADLEAIGLTVQLRPHKHGEYRSFVVSGQEGLFIFGWVGIGASPDTYLAPVFRSTSDENVTGFDDPAVDEAIASARATADAEERYGVYGDAESSILAAAPIVPLAQLVGSAVVSERVRDLVSRPDGTFVAEKAWLAG